MSRRTPLKRTLNLFQLVLYGLGTAWYRAGNMEKARQVFETLTGLNTRGLGITTADIWYGTSYCDLVSLSHYYLGKVYLKAGETEKARQSLKTFISLWQECDPPFRKLVQDARQGLEGL